MRKQVTVAMMRLRRYSLYAHTLEHNVALAQVPPALDAGDHVDVEVLGEPVRAEIATTVLYDPENARIDDVFSVG